MSFTIGSFASIILYSEPPLNLPLKGETLSPSLHGRVGRGFRGANIEHFLIAAKENEIFFEKN
jgi:hypothetical protein